MIINLSDPFRRQASKYQVEIMYDTSDNYRQIIVRKLIRNIVVFDFVLLVNKKEYVTLQKYCNLKYFEGLSESPFTKVEFDACQGLATIYLCDNKELSLENYIATRNIINFTK